MFKLTSIEEQLAELQKQKQGLMTLMLSCQGDCTETMEECL